MDGARTRGEIRDTTVTDRQADSRRGGARRRQRRRRRGAAGAGAAVGRRTAEHAPARGRRRRIGADVPFFLSGGTALGLGRGEEIYPLVDLPPHCVVIVRPPFGVSTAEAYGWYDEDRAAGLRENREFQHAAGALAEPRGADDQRSGAAGPSAPPGDRRPEGAAAGGRGRRRPPCRAAARRFLACFAAAPPPSVPLNRCPVTAPALSSRAP